MKKIVYNSMFAILLSTSFVACSDTNAQHVTQLSAKEFNQKIDKNKVQLVDVRTPGEFQSGHLSNAVNIDISESTFDQKIALLDKNQPIYVYCKGGGRSAEAATKLKELGFKQVFDMKGGIMAWNNANLPIETATSTGAATDQKIVNTSDIPKENEHISIDDYKKIIASNKVVIVDFNAVWCGPCKKISPILDRLAKEYEGKVLVKKIDVDKSPELAKEMKIEGIPYILKYVDGKLVKEIMGFNGPAEIEALFKN